MKKSILLLFLSMILIAGVSLAQGNTTTPYESMRTFLYYLQEDSFEPDTAALPFLRQSISREVAIDKAVKLKQILDGKGYYIDMGSVPNQENFIDSASSRARYTPVDDYPSIYLEKVGDKWLFSNYSLEAIDRVHHEAFPFGTARLLKLLPKLGTKKYFGLRLWQLIGLLALTLICFVTHRLLTLLFDYFLAKVFIRLGYKEVVRKVLAPVARPLSLLVIFGLLLLFVPILQLPVNINHYIILGLRAAIPLIATVLVYRLVDILGHYLMEMAKKTESTLDDQLVPLLKKTLKTFVVIVGTIFILQNLDFNVTALIAGLSIGGLAFALAAQDTIKNFFGSLMIFIDRPFQIGHWITSGEIDGTVEEVGFRSTRVRTFRNSLVYVPNGKMADSVIDNHGLRVYRRFYTRIAITYDTPTHIIEDFVDGLKQIVASHPKTRKDYYEIHLNDFGASSLDIMFYIFFEVPSWSEELRSRHEIMLEIIRLAENLGVNFAFPTQTIHVENLPGQPSLSPNYMDANDSRSTLSGFLKGIGKKN